MITIDDYIYSLREVQSTLELIRGDLDRAIDRIENGQETFSRLAALSAVDLLCACEIDIKKVATTKFFRYD